MGLMKGNYCRERVLWVMIARIQSCDLVGWHILQTRRKHLLSQKAKERKEGQIVRGDSFVKWEKKECQIRVVWKVL
jgi:hypothetical protein